MTYFNSIFNLKHYLLFKKPQPVNRFFGIYRMNFLEDSKNSKKLRIDKIMDNGLFGTTLFGEVKYVAGIDIFMENDISEITYHTVNDQRFAKDYDNMYGDCVNDTDSQLLRDCLFSFAECASKEKNIKKIKCDVHQNLINYNDNIKQYGFKKTNKKAIDNPFWIETIKEI